MSHTLRSLAFILFLCSFVSSTLAQETGTVSGKITDATTGEGLPSATVSMTPAMAGVKKVGAISKSDGSFTIKNIPPGAYTLRIAYIGYKLHTEEVTVTGGQEITKDIKLELDWKHLDEVVVTGLVSKRFKSESEVAVSQVPAAELTSTQSYENLSQLIAGKAAGVHVLPASGNVGGGVRFDVRSGGGLNGTGQPLIYIDGVRVANGEVGPDLTGGQRFSSISELNPNDIESIDILKGPAASALYGTSGANGVVIIRTKGGRAGDSQAPNYHYRISTGWNEQATEYGPNVLTAKDANAIFKTGPFTEHLVSASGQSDIFNYYTSFTTRNEEGIILNNSFERKGIRANLGVIPSEKVAIRAAANYVFSNTILPPNDNNIEGFLGNTLLLGEAALGGPSSYYFTDSESIAGIKNANDDRSFLGSLDVTYNPIPELTLHAIAGYNGGAARIDQIHPAHLRYTGLPSGSRYVEHINTDNTNIDLSAAYDWKPSESINATTAIGMQAVYATMHTLQVSRQDFPSTLITNIGAAVKDLAGDETFFDAREAGLFFVQDLTFDETYLLTIGVRNDYSSSIGETAPSIFYPRAGFAVQLNKLDLLPEAFNLFKLRAAYGESGTLPRPFDGSNLLWEGTKSGYGTGASVNILGNPSIEPERIKEFEVGLEIELNKAYGLDFTYFIQQANHSIIGFINAPSTGFTTRSTPMNVGSIEGSGFEANLYGQIFRTTDYQLDLDLKWSYASNEVVDLGPAPPIIVNENAVIVGQPRAAFWGKAVRGALFDDQGAFAGPDVDSVESFLGNPVAPNSGSFSLNFRFLKNFKLYGLVDWSLGGTIHNLTRTFQTQYLNDQEYNQLLTKLGFGAFDTTVSALTVGSPEYRDAANRFAQLDYSQAGAIGFFESSDNLRIREISLSYDFTDALRDIDIASTLRSATLSLGVRNLFLFTDYSGTDVEVSSAGSSETIYRGQDFLTLQNPRVFYGTLTIGF